MSPSAALKSDFAEYFAEAYAMSLVARDALPRELADFVDNL
jgi:hypothetical protein